MRKILKRGIALLAGAVIGLGGVAGFLPTVTANAGKSEQKVITEEMYKEELSNQKWYFTRDIAQEEGKIVFKKDITNAASKIVSVILANDLRAMGIETCINGTLKVKVTEALSGEFYIGFGLDRPYSEVNSASAICLYANGDAVGLKVQNFAGDNAGVVYTAPTTYAYGEEIVIDFDVLSVGSMYLAVNETTLLNYDNATAVETNGYFGFGQSAASSVEIYDAEIRAATYDTPTNSDFTETFSDGFNASLLYSEGSNSGYYTPEKVVCEDGVLKFTNVTVTGYISTRYEYSNFSMTYDIPHIQRQAELDDEGIVRTPATNWMGVSIGCASVKTTSAVAVAQSLFFFMMPVYVEGRAVSMSCTLLNNYKTLKTTSVSGENNFFAVENGLDSEGKERGVNLKVEMIDGVLQVFMKYEGESVNRYVKIFDYDLGYTPLGYVQIWGYGDAFTYVQQNIAEGKESLCANYWIDNLKIENKDQQAKLIEVGFTSSKFPEQTDFVYVDQWDNRAETLFSAEAPKKKRGWLIALCITVPVVAALGTVGTVWFIKKKKGGKKEE